MKCYFTWLCKISFICLSSKVATNPLHVTHFLKSFVVKRVSVCGLVTSHDVDVKCLCGQQNTLDDSACQKV